MSSKCCFVKKETPWSLSALLGCPQAVDHYDRPKDDGAPKEFPCAQPFVENYPAAQGRKYGFQAQQKGCNHGMHGLLRNHL